MLRWSPCIKECTAHRSWRFGLSAEIISQFQTVDGNYFASEIHVHEDSHLAHCGSKAGKLSRGSHTPLPQFQCWQHLKGAISAQSFLNLRNYFGETAKNPNKISSALNIELRGEGGTLKTFWNNFSDRPNSSLFHPGFFTCEIISVNSRVENFADWWGKPESSPT